MIPKFLFDFNVILEESGSVVIDEGRKAFEKVIGVVIGCDKKISVIVGINLFSQLNLPHLMTFIALLINILSLLPLAIIGA
jgi:hypothetical protein